MIGLGIDDQLQLKINPFENKWSDGFALSLACYFYVYVYEIILNVSC